VIGHKTNSEIGTHETRDRGKISPADHVLNAQSDRKKTGKNVIDNSDNVQQGEQKDPDEVDKVPIKTDVFNEIRVSNAESTSFHQNQHKHQQAYDDVNCVKSRHQEIV
jgi:hypothetical protein